MGMFDTIGANQVKCFRCKLQYYDKDSIVPCDEFGYKNNILILPFNTYLDDHWESSEFIFIKDSKVCSYKTIGEIEETDFDDIEEVINYLGTKIKISNLDDLFNYIEDIMLMKVKDDMDELRGNFNDNYEPFKEKWII